MKSQAKLTVSAIIGLTLIDKNITSLKFSDLKLTLVGPQGLNKLGFVDTFGHFKVYVPDSGVYKLEVFHTKFFFEPVVVEIKEDPGQSQHPYAAFMFTLNGSKGQRLMYPLQLEPGHKIKYFDIEEKFNPLVYLKSPMVLMIGVSMVMMFMMKQVPKDEMEKYQEEQGETMK